MIDEKRDLFPAMRNSQKHLVTTSGRYGYLDTDKAVEAPSGVPSFVNSPLNNKLVHNSSTNLYSE
jgi:hypothetical protein